jgi:hypothetical protein
LFEPKQHPPELPDLVKEDRGAFRIEHARASGTGQMVLRLAGRTNRNVEESRALSRRTLSGSFRDVRGHGRARTRKLMGQARWADN